MMTLKQAADNWAMGWLRLRQRSGATYAERDALVHLDFAPGALVRTHYEIVITDQPPAAVLAAVRRDALPPAHWLTLIDPGAEAMIPDYERGGYHLLYRQYFMGRSLTPTSFAASPQVMRVSSEDERVWFNAQFDRDVVSPTLLADPDFGAYYVQIEGRAACRGSCMIVDGMAVVDGIETLPDFQRRGLGTKIMSTLLADAARRGATYTTLIATDDGHKLYSTMGYEVLAPVRVFSDVPAEDTAA